MAIYRLEKGCCLGIQKDYGRYYISWHDPQEWGFFYTVGEDLVPVTPPKEKDALEDWLADMAVRHSSDGKDELGHYFNTLSKARKALAEANKALLEGFYPPVEYRVPEEKVKYIQGLIESNREAAKRWRVLEGDNLNTNCCREARVLAERAAERAEEEAQLIEGVLYELIPELEEKE